MRSRRVSLICVPVLLALALAVGFPLKSKTAVHANPAGDSMDQSGKSKQAPTSATGRPFSGSLPEAGKLALSVPRRNHTATTLNDGRVLIIGGDNQDGSVSETEMLDPKSSTLTVMARSLIARTKHAATLLPNGKVLVTGGSDQNAALDSTELFDPKTGAFSAGPRLQRARAGHSATLLGNGLVLIAGGQGEDSAELYHPGNNQSTLLSGKLVAPRYAHSALLLADGSVLVAGGEAGNGHNLDAAEIFNPATQRFSATAFPMMLGRARATLRQLPDGKVQVIGGDSDGSMEIYDPATGRFGALVHLAPTAELFPETGMMSSQSRAGFIEALNYRDARMKRPATSALKAAFGEMKKQQAGRSKYAVADIPGANQTLIAGGISDDGKIIDSALLLPSSPASVSTNQVQYLPGEAAIITGTGWQAGEAITIIRQEANLGHERRTLGTVADQQGNFVCTDLTANDHQDWTAYTLTANGAASNQVAQTAYFDAPPPGREKETLGAIKFQIPLTSRDFSFETETVTLKWKSDSSAREGDEFAAAAATASCAFPDGNLFNFSSTLPDVVNQPCLGTPGNLCQNFGDVRITSACLAARGDITAEICLLCPDGSGGFVTPYAKFTVRADSKGQATMAVRLDDSFQLPLFNFPTPLGIGSTVLPGLDAVFSATVGLTARARVKATVVTPTAFNAIMDFGESSETGFDSRLDTPFINNVTSPSTGGDVVLTKLGEASAKLHFGPNIGVLVTLGPATIMDFGVGILGFIEPSITSPRDEVTCKSALIDLHAGIEGDATARLIGIFNESAQHPFVEQQVVGYPKPFTFADTQPPVITNIPDIVQGINPATCSTMVLFNPTIVDDCSGPDLSTLQMSHQSGAIFPLGQTTVTVSVKDRAGNPATASFKVTIICPTNMLVTTLPSAPAGTHYTETVANTPPGTYSYSLISGALPPGVSLSPTTGSFSGIPSQAGTYNFVIQATGCGGNCVGSQAYTLNLTCPIITLTPSALAQGQTGQIYNDVIYSSVLATTTFSLASGMLPNGLMLSSGGQISGTPTGGGTFDFVVKASFGVCETLQSYAITIDCPPTLGLMDLPSPKVGYFYPETIRVSGSGVYTFSVGSGTVPPGLTLSPNGNFVGVPTQLGTFTFTINAGGAGLCPLSRTYALQVVCGTILFDNANGINPFGTAGVPYNDQFLALPGGNTYTFSHTGGTLPPGLTLAADGKFSGIPTQIGEFNFTITAASFGGACPGSQDYKVRIGCVVDFTFSPFSLSNGAVGAAYNQAITITNPPAGNYTYGLHPSFANIPPGLTLSSNGTIAGTPTTPGTYTFTVEASGFANPLSTPPACGRGRSYTITVTCPDISLSSLPGGKANTPYNQTITALPAGGGYTFALTGGTLPDGLNFSNGVITGTPTKAGTFNFTVMTTATSFANCTKSQEYSLTITCPTITVSSLPGGTAGTAYNQTITASPSGGSYTFELTGGTLPDGLSFNNGVITGTPTKAGPFIFTVTVTGFGACPKVHPYAIMIACPTITLSSLPGGAAGIAYNQTIMAGPAGGAYSFVVSAGNLPPGLSLTAGGALTGTPTLAGTFNFTVTATGFGSCPQPQNYSLVITCPTISLSPETLPNAVANVPYVQALTATPGGSYGFSLANGSLLPPGLTLNSDGTFSGAPAQTGTFNFRVVASGFGSCSGFRDYQLTVTCSTVSLNPAGLPGGTVGAAYDQTIVASPIGAYSYQVTSGALPNGLMLNAASGRITGAPATNGAFTFTVMATGGGCLGSRSYTINIGCAAMSITTASLAAGAAGNTYSQSLNVSPAGSYTFSLAQGNLPAGLTLHPQTGVISGLPAVAGTVSFIVKAQAANGCSVTQSYTLQINCPTVSLSPASLPNGATTAAYNQTFSATPAGGNYSFSVTAGALPTGLSLNSATGALTGTPTANGAYNFTITATGFGSCPGSKAYSITIGNGGCPAMTMAELPGGAPGQLYNHLITTTPSGTYSYAVTTGSLPPGLTLYGSMGMLFGYPTTAGTFTFTVTATDSNNCTGSKQLTLTIGGAAVQSLVFGDFDGDGRADLSVWRGQSGDWLTVNSSDGKLKTEAWGSTVAPYFDVMTPGDYDGDGKMDVAVFRRSTGQWLIKGSKDGAVTAKVWGLATDVPVPGDYDGDGKTDIAVWRGTETNWYILRSSDGQTESISWGTSRAPYLDVPVAADFDGDGKTDVAVFRQQNGHWYIQLSSDGSTLDKAWGLGTDVPVAADYDGDGKADVAVWRGSETNWYILRSSDGAVQSISWGASLLGDVPVPGDYDGDGKADVAVWRANDGNWYAKRSSDNSVLTRLHGQAGDTPVSRKPQM